MASQRRCKSISGAPETEQRSRDRGARASGAVVGGHAGGSSTQTVIVADALRASCPATRQVIAKFRRCAAPSRRQMADSVADGVLCPSRPPCSRTGRPVHGETIANTARAPRSEIWAPGDGCAGVPAYLSAHGLRGSRLAAGTDLSRRLENALCKGVITALKAAEILVDDKHPYAPPRRSPYRFSSRSRSLAGFAGLHDRFDDCRRQRRARPAGAKISDRGARASFQPPGDQYPPSIKPCPPDASDRAQCTQPHRALGDLGRPIG
jgi:hypothetical protein